MTALASNPTPIKRVPPAYVVLGVTAYCTMIWAAAIVGLNAGARALFPGPSSYAASSVATQASVPDADE